MPLRGTTENENLVSASIRLFSQDESLNYYVFLDVEIPKPKWSGEHFVSKVNQIEHRLDELVSMYKEWLMTFEEISEETGIEWWTIMELFRERGIQTISLSQRAKLKREKDFDLIYKFHFEEKVGINELYRKCGCVNLSVCNHPDPQNRLSESRSS